MTDTTPAETMQEEEDDDTRVLIPVPVLDAEPAEKPKFYVFNDALVAQTGEGELRLSLKIKTKLVPVMEDKPPREQFDILLQAREEHHLIDFLDELDIVDSREIVRKFFQAFGEKQQARLGESFSSSHS